MTLREGLTGLLSGNDPSLDWNVTDDEMNLFLFYIHRGAFCYAGGLQINGCTIKDHPDFMERIVKPIREALPMRLDAPVVN